MAKTLSKMSPSVVFQTSVRKQIVWVILVKNLALGIWEMNGDKDIPHLLGSGLLSGSFSFACDFEELEITLRTGKGKARGLRRETGFSSAESVLFSSPFPCILI